MMAVSSLLLISKSCATPTHSDWPETSPSFGRRIIHLYDAALDNVVIFVVADREVLTLPVIDRAEDGLNFFRL